MRLLPAHSGPPPGRWRMRRARGHYWRDQWRYRSAGMKLPAAAYSAEAVASAAKAGSCGVSCEILRPVGQSLWAACRSHYPPSPRLRRVLPAFIPVAAYSAEVATSATKAGSYGVFGEGESIRTRENPIRDRDERDFQYAIDHQKRRWLTVGNNADDATDD